MYNLESCRYIEYLFRFTAENDWNLSARNWNEYGFSLRFSAHADQLYYLLWYSRDAPNEIYLNLKPDSLQRQIIKNVANFYANFAKFG